jgi:hypothetical protein
MLEVHRAGAGRGEAVDAGPKEGASGKHDAEKSDASGNSDPFLNGGVAKGA